jgi:hypothetical protein
MNGLPTGLRKKEEEKEEAMVTGVVTTAALRLQLPAPSAMVTPDELLDWPHG